VAGRLPFAAEVFDVVFVSQVLHHLPDLAEAMAEARRVLTNRGRLLVRQSTRENLDSYFYQRFFPEARAIDEGRLPGRADVIDSAGAAGLSLVGLVRSVRMEVGASGREYVEKVATRTNTDLAMISDEAFARGFEAFSRHCQENPTHPRSEEVDHFVFAAM
jgi:SAM-dependent methyltransferase